jgi:predicted amidohydrolase
VKVAAIQHDIAWQDGPANRVRIEPMIAQAAAANARLIVLTEMFATGFSMDTDAISEDQAGPNERFLRDMARQHDVWLIGSVAQWSGPPVAGQTRRAVNVAIVAGPQGELYRYCKIHPFSYAGEHEHFAAGTDFLTVGIDDLRVSVFICYDLRFADEFWQRALETDLYVVPANWPEPRREHWRALLKARAIENQAYVLGCNRVGTEGAQAYTGDSAIIDPLGRTLAEASRVETVLIAEVDSHEVRSVRNKFPFLADRR